MKNIWDKNTIKGKKKWMEFVYANKNEILLAGEKKDYFLYEIFYTNLMVTCKV